MSTTKLKELNLDADQKELVEFFVGFHYANMSLEAVNWIQLHYKKDGDILTFYYTKTGNILALSDNTELTGKLLTTRLINDLRNLLNGLVVTMDNDSRLLTKSKLHMSGFLSEDKTLSRNDIESDVVRVIEKNVEYKIKSTFKLAGGVLTLTTQSGKEFIIKE